MCSWQCPCSYFYLVFMYSMVEQTFLYHCARISILSEALQLLPVKVNFFLLNFTYSLVIDMFHVLKLHSLFTTDTNQIKELQQNK